MVRVVYLISKVNGLNPNLYLYTFLLISPSRGYEYDLSLYLHPNFDFMWDTGLKTMTIFLLKNKINKFILKCHYFSPFK